MSEFAKDITYKRIKRLLETYVGNPRKRITLNQLRGQVISAVNNRILDKSDIERMKEEIEKELERNALYPFGPLSREQKLKRFHKVEEIIMHASID